MTGEIGAAGDIATGMLVGRAVEPRAGEAAHASAGHGICLNCGTALIGDYCHACGQSGHVHRTLSAIGHDLLHGVFHFEGKVWRTLPMLVTRPGTLTRRYIAGERARFVSPLALFLFSVFLMFAVLHSNIGEVESTPMSPTERTAEVAKADAKLATANNDFARETAHSPRRDEKIASITERISSLKSRRDALVRGEDVDAIHFTDFKTNWPALDKGVAKANANPGLALYKLQSSAYKYSWALIPISTPFVALLFLWRRRFKLYDHAIFVTYSLAFMMLLVVTLSVLLTIDAPRSLFDLILLVAPPVHLFAQLRSAYSLRKRSALWRTVALLMFACVALTAFAVLLLALGFME